MEGLIDDTGRITDPYRNFIHVSRYARWLKQENRRETWVETVDRYIGFMTHHLKVNTGYEPPVADVELVRNYILEHKALPSMRALMTAGPALERDNIAGYNCSYAAVDDPRVFSEILYILMNGTGVGFSAELKYTSKLPTVPFLDESDEVVVVADSKLGWAESFQAIIDGLYSGVIRSWNTDGVRPAGSRLETFGGRASGPEPLVDLFNFTVNTFIKAQGRQLTPLEVHDIVCKIADVVVVGGVRRSALISLGDLDSDEMRGAKSGQWWEANPHRRLANNSAVYESKPSKEVFYREWAALIDSGSGERGIFNREASKLQASKWGRRSADIDYGTNPCSEIILRNNQFCNLSTIVVREDDSVEDLQKKVVVATILGTWQSTLTNFQYIRDIWTQNTEEERLLGVSMTGAFDNRFLNGSISMSVTEGVLQNLRDLARRTNEDLAAKIGIPASAAIACIKPEGTTSQKTLTASGLHTWYNDYYIRTVRADKKDPLTQFMMDAGFYWEDDVMKPDETVVFYFAIAAPQGALTRHDITAIQHLELWLAYQRYWCEHKPSITINVKNHEWGEVADWVYDHFDEISGVSFMPSDESEHTYAQAPYQDLTAEEYAEWTYKMPAKVNWDLLSAYELEDSTTSTQDLACVAGACDVVDMVAS